LIRPIRPPSWQELNAYVDGALAPDAARLVERAAALDPAVARALDELGRLKQATGELLVATGDCPAPPAVLAAAPVPGARRTLGIDRRAWAMAAAILLLLAGLWLWPQSPTPGSGATAWLAEAEALHLARAQEPRTAAAEAVALPAALAPEAATFDLGLAGLALVLTEESAGGLYLGYEGSRGCRLGLWIAPAPADLAAALTGHHRDGLLLVTWRSGDTGFALLSQDMDPRRFAGIAQLLRERTASGGTQLAADGEVLSLPCVG